MSYKIINKRGTFLSGFHSNGGWEISDVFPCSSLSAITFKTEKEAQKYLLSMREELIKQQDRWGDWLDTALKFWKTLSITNKSLLD